MKLLSAGKKIILIVLGALPAISFCGCALDIAPRYVSDDIAESKKLGFFKFEYIVDSLQNIDKNKPFIIQSAWAEKAHTSTTNYWGKETYEQDPHNFQIVFEMAPKSYYNIDNNSRWLMVDEDRGLDGGEGGLIYMSYSKAPPLPMKFKIYWQKSEVDFKHDTTKVCEFILKKKP